MTQSLATKLIHKLALRLATTVIDEATHRVLTAQREKEAQEADAKAIFEAHVRRTKGE